MSVLSGNIRSCKDLLMKGANRATRNNEGQTPKELAEACIKDRDLCASFTSALAKPWYTGCPLGRLPLMPIERTKRAQILFIVLFFFIYVT